MKISVRGLATSIDCHTHMYTPKYMNILRKRVDIPRVQVIDGIDRLIVLPDEDKNKSTAVGRVIGREYWDVDAKLRYLCVQAFESLTT